MIVQSSIGRDSHFVLTMEQHTATGGVLAEHFGGTAQFDRLVPTALMVDLVREHDRGWVEVDEAAPQDPSTGLPWSVYETPVAVSIETGPRSIDYNERCHPYRGLLASMHMVGLHTGRYGLKDDVGLDSVDAESRALLEAMIRSEHVRQDRLKASLTANDQTAAWLDEAALMHNYKALQFFDGLALWLQVTHPSLRKEATFDHVPTAGSEDVSVMVTPLDASRVSLDPYPFDISPLEIVIEGRWLAPQQPDADLAQALDHADLAQQPVSLCSS